MSLVITGTIAYDSLKTPYGSREKILGGSAAHSSIAASLLTDKIKLLGVVGNDFKHLNIFKKNNIDVSGVEVVKNGKTFHWSGYYEKDMGQAFTIQTDLNVFAQVIPTILQSYQKTDYLLLGNMDPQQQLATVKSIAPKFSAMDTMNFWIDSKKTELLKTIKNTDLLFINQQELCQLMQEHNTVKAAQELLKKGAKYLIVKKGEHGAMLFHQDAHKKFRIVVVPAYPLAKLKDPTGAGDSFAGGVMGYLNSKKKNDFKTIAQGMLYGTAIASYMVEDFSSNKILKITKQDVVQRVKEICQLSLGI